MSLEIGVTFIIERVDENMHPTESFYNDKTNQWEQKSKEITLPKYDILSSGIYNAFKELDFITDFNGDYTSCPKELWDVMGITEELKKSPYATPCRELQYSELDDAENQIKQNIENYQKDYNIFYDLLSKSVNEESYNINYENMKGQQELIDLCNNQLDIIKDFKSIWNYMEEEDRLHYVEDKNGKYVKDKLRVVISYYY